MAERIVNVVATGAPCSGKTSAVEYIAQKLRSTGVSVLVAPEIATLLDTAGFKIAAIAENPALVLEFQKQALLLQISVEERLHALARTLPGTVVVLSDRGPMDGAAYMGAAFKGLLDSLGLTTAEARDRYDLVVFLRTAAIGAEYAYNLGNPARHETLEEARALDTATFAAWNGHGHIRIVENTEPDEFGAPKPITFEAKLQRALGHVCRTLGIPTPLEIERKFLVRKFTLPPGVATNKVRITQTYLTPGHEDPLGATERRVRRIDQVEGLLGHGGTTYTYTEKSEVRPGVRAETERTVSGTEYFTLLNEAHPRKGQIVKTRTTFGWGDLYFELDEFERPSGLTLLEVELTEESQTVTIPACIEIDSEVTGSPRYRNARIATYLWRIPTA